MSRWWWLVVSFVFLSGALTPLPAQEVPNISETIDVSIVNLEVFVTDRKGKRVEGLTRDDFEIYENGVLKPISNFAEYVGGVSAEAGDASGAETRQRRTLVLFIDRFSIPPQRVAPMFVAIKNLVRDTIEPGDSLAIVSWNRLLVTRLPFTDNVGEGLRALDAIEKESSIITRDPLTQIEREREWLENVSAYAASRGFAINTAEFVPMS